jgi:hypothetical protein
LKSSRKTFAPTRLIKRRSGSEQYRGPDNREILISAAKAASPSPS